MNRDNARMKLSPTEDKKACSHLDVYNFCDTTSGRELPTSRTLPGARSLPWTNAQSRHTSNEPAREETGQLCGQCVEETIDDDAAPAFQCAQARGDGLLRRTPAAKRCRLSDDIEKGCLFFSRAHSPATAQQQP